MSRRVIAKRVQTQQPHATAPAAESMDERVRRSRDVVLRVTSDLLTAHGVGGVSVDEISRRSGVAKTTIYRHWRTRSDLIIDACSLISTEQQVPDSGSFESDVTILLLNLAHLLRTAKWTSVLPSIVDAAERDPELAAIHSKLQIGHTKPYLEIIDRGKRKGEIPSKIDASMMVAELVGPLFYRRWFSREALDDKFVKSVIRNVMCGQA
jgi:AcrR family transcriptional regulator